MKMICFSLAAPESTRPYFPALIVIALLFPWANARAQETKDNLDGSLKKLSLEELMSIEVTSVSKRPEKLTEVASAIQVITREDILRSGATCIPEALRLAPNLQVAQLTSFGWIISARGFNNVFSNKLLVMIDGRTVYTPLLAGVYWDVQSVLLEDVDRIEVISGPGGTLWGANAVNGVINIITKKSSETKGLYVSGAAGSLMRDFGAIRYGGKIGQVSYRAFAQRHDRNPTQLTNGENNADKWNLTQGGIRLDWDSSEKDVFSFQANSYGGTEYTNPGPSTFDGQNALARWAHTFSPKSDLVIQTYFDRTWRKDLPSTFDDELKTYDLDFQHHFLAGKRHNFVWGAGYRFMQDKSQHSSPLIGFVPLDRNMPLISGFVQDEIMVLPERLRFTIGTKLLNNVFTGFELQPSARLAWTPSENHTLWIAVSRAVRTPSRIDVDYHIPTYPVPPGSLHINGGPNFQSEKVIAYEAGWRWQPAPTLSLSSALFYNQYDDLYSVEPLPGTLTYEIQNGVEGYSWGAEISGLYQVVDRWRLRAGYTLFHKSLKDKPGHSFDTSYAGTDPRNQYMLQSMLDLPGHFQLDATGRYVDSLPASAVATVPRVSAYFEYNLRLAWTYRTVELSVVGQNLAKAYHVEFSSNHIPRNVYGKITWRL